MENDQYTFVLGALARIDKKVDIMNSNIQEMKIDLIHMQEDVDEARADISELKQYNNQAISKHIEEEMDEFEDEFEK
jgi:hypothetical protein